MRIWFDTEFIEDGRTIDLISIGKASDDKRDAALKSIGVQTVRASGSDITLRPRTVTRRVGELVQEWLR